MRRFWGFVSGSKDGRIQRPIRYVSFRSNKVRVMCQNLVTADFKDFFVGACYASNVPQEVNKTDAPHFNSIHAFTLYMRKRKGGIPSDAVVSKGSAQGCEKLSHPETTKQTGTAKRSEATPRHGDVQEKN